MRTFLPGLKRRRVAVGFVGALLLAGTSVGVAESAHAATSYPKYSRCKPGFWSHSCVAGPVRACSDHTVRVDIASLPNSYFRVYDTRNNVVVRSGKITKSREYSATIGGLYSSYKVYLGDSQWTTNDAWYASISGC